MCGTKKKKEKKKTNQNYKKLGRILEGPKGGQFTGKGTKK